jgi:hypothetical protein
MKETLQRLFAHMQWADEEVHVRCRDAHGEAEVAHLTEALRLYSHIVAAERLWYLRLQKEDWDELLRRLRGREVDFFVAEVSTLEQELDLAIEPMAEHPLFFVPAGQFDVARVDVVVSVAKGDLVTQVDREPIDWSPAELEGAKDSCGGDLAGDLSVEPVHWTSWAVRSQTPVVGQLFPDRRQISVEWRPVAVVWEDLTGSTCDPYEVNESLDVCEAKLGFGTTGPGSWVEPVISYCASDDGPDACELTWTMPVSRALDLEHDLGLAESRASASIVLWPEADPGPTPDPFAPFP